MSAKPQRKSQEQRTADARALLARAAFELIRDNGYANFRVAAVAKHAGISQGGQLHHFPTKDDVTQAAIEYAIETAREQTHANLQNLTEQDDVVRAIEADCRDYYFSDNFDVAMDITKGVAGNKVLNSYISRSHRVYREHTESAWISMLSERGWSETDAETVVAMTASMVRGLAIRAMIKPDPNQYKRLLTSWHDMVRHTYSYEKT